MNITCVTKAIPKVPMTAPYYRYIPKKKLSPGKEHRRMNLPRQPVDVLVTRCGSSTERRGHLVRCQSWGIREHPAIHNDSLLK
jgi:hypothetical protein